MKHEQGQIITFYSYKGGTGRTMALANIAVLMAKNHGKKVLIIDWDLEAPGLHRYFAPYFKSEESIIHAEGLIDFVYQAKDSLEEQPSTEFLLDFFAKHLTRYILPTTIDHLSFLKAGRYQTDYASKIQDFQWMSFYERFPEFFSAMALYLSKHYDFVLIDSRTGLTDTGGICTMTMPDKLVLCFTPNTQSLEGVIRLFDDAIQYRKGSIDGRPLQVFPLACRIENSEYALLKKWRVQYQESFEMMFEKSYLPISRRKVETISLDHYFDNVQIPHVPVYAYGEKISTTLDRISDINTLAYRFDHFCKVLSEDHPIWEYHFESPTMTGTATTAKTESQSASSTLKSTENTESDGLKEEKEKEKKRRYKLFLGALALLTTLIALGLYLQNQQLKASNIANQNRIIELIKQKTKDSLELVELRADTNLYLYLDSIDRLTQEIAKVEAKDENIVQLRSKIQVLTKKLESQEAKENSMELKKLYARLEEVKQENARLQDYESDLTDVTKRYQKLLSDINLKNNEIKELQREIAKYRKVDKPTVLSLASKVDDVWLKPNYYEDIGKIRLSLLALDEDKGMARIKVAAPSVKEQEDIVRSISLGAKEIVDLTDMGTRVEVIFVKIDGAGKNPFTKAAFFNIQSWQLD